jgi:crotonobetainyl-CoA:carnitine CoA-transferase CaiB-like acyl-CoA transferase
MNRMARFSEWNAIVHAFTRRHTTAEIVERASQLRIPVAPVSDGRSVREHEHLVERPVVTPLGLRDRASDLAHALICQRLAREGLRLLARQVPGRPCSLPLSRTSLATSDATCPAKTAACSW